MTPLRRRIGRVILAVLFAAAAINALAQVALVPLGRSNDPAALVALQLIVGLAGAAAAWGTWARARWAPAAAVLYGVAIATLLLALEPILDLGEEARGGLRGAAALMFALALLAAWYLRRSSRDRGTAV